MSEKFRDEAKLAQENGFFVRTVEGGYLLSGDSIALGQYTEAILSASQAREAELREKRAIAEAEEERLMTESVTQRERAEAAEARIKELEAQLTK